MLRLEVLPAGTRAVFEYLQASDLFRGLKMTLFGGTALALLLAHRRSEDLDFFSCAETLPVEGIKRLLAQMRGEGFVISNIMDVIRITQARINGIRLEELIQEYSINGVKVSFGTFSKGGEVRRRHFAQAPCLPLPEASFRIPDLHTLFESKAVVLRDRVMARDLFDLMVLVKAQGYRIEDILTAIVEVDGVAPNEAEAVLEVLLGNVPVNASDPGFLSIGLVATLAEIHAFFAERVNAYERQRALQALSS